MCNFGATSEVSSDGKQVICRSMDRKVRWIATAPSEEEWNRLAKHPVLVNLKAGVFQYSENEVDGVIVAVFTPAGQGDFNLTYDADSGDLLLINEAR